MRYLPALLLGRIVRIAVRLVRPGGGSALPGLILSKLAPNLVHKTLSSFRSGLVVITGTAGKSTTTKMAVAIVRAHGVEVFTNPSTANIEQGFFSTIIRHGNLFGKVSGDIAIIEMDEAHAALVAKRVPPKISVILNVFEDQLDRFIDPALVREMLADVARATSGKVLLNADDQNCLLIEAQLPENRERAFFGLGDSFLSGASEGIDYAPTYLPTLAKPKAAFQVMSLTDRTVSIRVGDREISFELPSRGIHFALDAVAALACAESILEERFDPDLASAILGSLPPVFSRGEVIEIDGEPVEFILVQNPISTELNLANLKGPIDQIMFAVGRDVHDPSWLWTVDLAKLKRVSVVTGFNYADAALALEYNNVHVDSVEADYLKAIDDFMKLPKPKHGIKTVIYSADAMRRLRRHMGFTDPEDVQRV